MNPSLSFFVGGLGSALADIHLGYTHYAIFTLIVKGLEAVIVSLLFHRMPIRIRVLVFVAAASFMVAGYYVSDAILYGDYIVAFSGVGFNIMQALFSLVIASTLLPIFEKITNRLK